MQQLEEYRKNLLDRLVDAAHEFRAACLAVRSPGEPVEQGGWSVHQLAAHTRDVDRSVYGERARRTLTEDNPVFPNFDADEHMRAHYDPEEPLLNILDDFVGSIEALAAQLRTVSGQAWARESSHATQGAGFTLQTWVERGLQHIEEHLQTARSGRRDL